MIWLPPVYPRNSRRMRKVGDLEPDVVRAKSKPPPYLDQPIVVSRSSYQLSVGRKLSEFGRIRKLLLPHEARTVGQEPHGETRVAYEKLVGRTP